MEITREDKLKILKRLLYCSRRKGNCLICYTGLSNNRPHININGKTYVAARFMMYVMENFSLDSALWVLHRDDLCSSSACIEYDHLKIGSASENTSDVIKKFGGRPWKKMEFCKRGHKRIPKNLDSKGYCIICDRIRARETRLERKLKEKTNA